MRAKRAWVLIIMLISIASRAAAEKLLPSETWMGIYALGMKIGYAQFRMEKATYRGKPAYRMDSRSYTHVLTLGMDVVQNVESSTYVDDKGTPKYQKFKMSSGGHSTLVTATFTAKNVHAVMQAAGTTKAKDIPIPKGAALVGDSMFLTPDDKPKIGDHWDLKSFNPLTLTLDDTQVDVLRNEDLEFDGKTLKTLVVGVKAPMGDMTCWQDSTGRLLKAVTVMGITMVREPKERAKSMTTGGEYQPPSDLAVMSSVKSSVDIPNPREVRHLKVRIEGITDKKLALSDMRQKASFLDNAIEYEVTASDFDPALAASLPVETPDMKEYLGDTMYIQPSNKEVAETARKVVGGEKNAYRAASLLRAWVDANIESKGDIGIIRPAVDVLHTRSGVCRDCAALYTSMARSVGIPTKYVAGIIFWKSGFYYHAWAESFVGEWMPFDATLPTDFVDATHIKMVEGDATNVFGLVKAVGGLKAEVLDFK